MGRRGKYVEGFPEIVKTDHQCWMCTLAQTHPDVVHVLHELYRRKTGIKEIMRRMEAVFVEAEQQLPTRQALTRHLRNHVDASRVEFKWQVGDESDDPDVQADADRRDFETDYFELRSIYREIKVIFTTFRHKFVDVNKDSTNDYMKVQMVLKLAGELRQMLKTLSDMRNSEKMTTAMLLRHTESVLELVSDPIGRELRTVRDLLRRGENVQVVANRLDQLISGDFEPILESAARRAIDQSKEQYNLH